MKSFILASILAAGGAHPDHGLTENQLYRVQQAVEHIMVSQWEHALMYRHPSIDRFVEADGSHDWFRGTFRVHIARYVTLGCRVEKYPGDRGQYRQTAKILNEHTSRLLLEGPDWQAKCTIRLEK